MNINWNLIPETMGIYIWKGLNGQIIYISKSKNIRRDMKLHFSDDNCHMENMYLKYIHGFDFIESNDFKEIIELEKTLIIEHRPKFCIKINSTEKLSYIELKFKNEIKLKVIRKINNGMTYKYFGPFDDSFSARTVVNLLLDILEIEKFNKTNNNYEKNFLIKEILNFSKGKTKFIEEKIEEKISLSIQENNYELEFKYKKYLNEIIIWKKEHNKTLKSSNQKDIVNFYIKDGVISISIIHIRYGIIWSTSNFLNKKFNPNIKEVLDSFVKGYYLKRLIPDKIIFPIELEWEEKQLMNIKVKPRDKENIDLLEKAKIHAKRKLFESIDNFVQEINDYEDALKFIKQNFINKEINNIEMIDFFTLNKYEKISVVVRFKKGIPSKGDYRKYISKTQDINQNLSYIKELIQMHFKNKKNFIFPDIFIVKDKVQLEVLKQILKEESIDEVIPIAFDSWNNDIATLINYKGQEFKFESDSHIHSFLNNMQEEIKKFFIHFHKNRNRMDILENQLDNFSYLSDYDKQQLFKTFKSKTKILHANKKSLSKVISKEKSIKLSKEYNG